MALSERQQQKQAAIGKLREQYARQRLAVAAIEPRLKEYFDGLTENVGVELGDENDLHNMMEVLGGVKFLRLLNQYQFDSETLADVIYKYEGTWEQVGRRWVHVCGGVKHPNDVTLDTYYRLRPYQVFILASIFGFRCWVNTKNEAGTRELRETEEERADGYIWDLRRLCTEFTLFTPRKTAKTQLSAFIQFWFFMNGDANAECFCCANAENQSKILFNRTKALIHQMDPNERRIRFTAKTVNWKTGQFRQAMLTALSAGGKTKDGTFAQLCSADEFGSAAYVNGASDMGKLVSVIESSMGPRREPLTFISTTAGVIQQGPFIDKLAAMERGLFMELEQEAPEDTDGADLRTVDDRHLCLLLQPDPWEREDDDYLLTSLPLRQKINPMLGIIVQHSFYDDEVSKARIEGPEKMNDVIAKDFNVYASAKTKEWIKPEEVRQLQVPMRIDNCLAEDGWVVFGGMDFSQGNDLHTIGYLAVNTTDDYPGPRFFADFDAWVSEDTLQGISIRTMYERWISDGHLRLCEGKVFQPSLLTSRVMELTGKGVNIAGFGYDPYQSKQVVNDLGAWIYSLGHDPKEFIVPVRQNFASYSPVVDEFTYMVKTDEPWVRFSGNPMWPWLFGNVALAVSNDGMDNKKPVKATSADSCKVDPVQAILSALMLYDQAEGKVQDL